MSRKTALLASVAALAVACEPEVGERTNTLQSNVVVFDLQAQPLPIIPLPNDVLRGNPAFLAANPALIPGFPANSAVTIQFASEVVDATGAQVRTAPPPALDPTTLAGSLPLAPNVFAINVDSGQPVLDFPASVAYAANPQDPALGQLTLQKAAPWAPGRYAVVLRGGPNGVKMQDGSQLLPDATLFIVVQDIDLNVQQNQQLLPGDTAEERAVAGQQLELLRSALAPLVTALTTTPVAPGAPPIITRDEIASLQVFTIRP
jgi:hypothetical protein